MGRGSWLGSEVGIWNIFADVEWNVYRSFCCQYQQEFFVVREGIIFLDLL